MMLHKHARSIIATCTAAAAILASNVQLHAAHPCPPDTNCSGTVNIDDLLAVINTWGGTNPDTDINSSGTVDIDDLLGVINAWGPCHFDYGVQYADAEAHQIGLEMLGATGPMTLAQAKYDRIVRDLGLIRAAYPALATQIHSPAWVPNQILRSLVNGQPLTDYNCLNTFYSLVSTQGSNSFATLTFPGKINVVKLSAIYDALPAVGFAEPNGYIGGQNFWKPTIQLSGNWRWNIDDGFTDCTDGCDCHYFYVLETDGPGNVIFISLTQSGQPWCVFP